MKLVPCKQIEKTVPEKCSILVPTVSHRYTNSITKLYQQYTIAILTPSRRSLNPRQAERFLPGMKERRWEKTISKQTLICDWGLTGKRIPPPAGSIDEAGGGILFVGIVSGLFKTGGAGLFSLAVLALVVVETLLQEVQIVVDVLLV